MILSAIFGSVALLSAGINLWQWIAAGRFPLHCRTANRDFAPAVTLLKPLKGADEETRACLESWLKQDYRGVMQVLFGVADAADPVCEIVRELKKQHADRDIELVICDPILGANAKVSTLTYLEAKAKYEFSIVSDADVLAPADLVSEVIQKFTHTEVALVNCFYKLSAKTEAMIWENIAVNADFWSQVCQSNSIKPMNFALGAVMAVRRHALEKIGGFKALLNQLADDYQLGRRIADTGGKIELATVVVECREGKKAWSDVWKHQLRWARTIRVCQPGPYFASVLSNTTLWTLLFTSVSGWNLLSDVCWVIRPLTAMHNSYRLTQTGRGAFEGIYAPLKDLLSFIVWVCAFTGDSVVWRGEKFLVKRGGELVKVQV